MTYTTGQAALIRHLVLLGVRLTALILLVVGTHALFNALVIAMGDDLRFRSIFVHWDQGFSWIGRALGLLLPGLALAIWSRRIAKWIVPGLRNECLNCGYVLHRAEAKRCPECGVVVSASEGERRGEG